MDIRSLTKKAKEICTGTSNAIKNHSAKAISVTKAYAAKYRVAVVIIAALTIMVMLMSMVLIKRRNVEIFIDGQQTASFATLEQQPEKWLEHTGTVLYEGDKLTVDGSTVHIDRAFYVTVTADGTDVTFKTTACTVKEAIEKAQITVGENDEISHEPDAETVADDRIVIYRKTSRTVTETEDIDFETVEKKTDKLYVGEKQVQTKGEKGEKEFVYEITYTDGEQTGKELISETVTKEPVDKVVLVGTKEIPKTQTASTPKTYKKVYTMKATAYTYGEDGGNITATGIRPYKGVVAVDPDVIPLGTKLYIEASDGSYIYGTAVAADTGGAIKGNKIDLFLTSESACKSFGRRTVNVYVLN